MSKVYSTAAVNFMNAVGSGVDLHQNMVILGYTGSQPSQGSLNSSADAAATGTPIVAYTLNNGVITREVLATAVFDLTGMTTAETITGITVGGIQILNGGTVTFAATIPATLLLVVAAINNYLNPLKISAAVVDTTKFKIIAPKNYGASLNGLAIVATGTAKDNTHVAINAGDADNLGQTPSAGTQVVGVAAANMLSVIEPPVLGVNNKSAGAWQGKGGSADIMTALAATGFTGHTTAGTSLTLGWARCYFNPSDPEINNGATPTVDTNYIYPRLDLAASDMGIVGGTAVAIDAVQTIIAFSPSTSTAAV